MPPRKKQRTSPAAEVLTPTASTPIDATGGRTADKGAADEGIKSIELEPEIWTDEEEISLFKGMIHWKPVGMHKHFRMISLAMHMQDQGHVSEHTRPSGIRQKLDGLYNMKLLDERENATEDGDAETHERYCEFVLPKYDFYDEMMGKRLDSDRDSSPGWLDEPGEEELGSAVEDSDEPLSSPASSVRATRGGRRGRGVRGSRGGRGRGNTDHTIRGRTKVESDASEDSEEEGAEEEDDGEEGDEDGEDEEEDEDAEEDAPAIRSSRGRGRGRAGRGVRGRNRGGRKRG